MTDSGEAPTPYRRLLLKLSGEALIGDGQYGISPDVIHRIATEVQQLHAMGIEMAVVIGGGNIFRGVAGAAGNGPYQCRLHGYAGYGHQFIALELRKSGLYPRHEWH